MALTRISCTSTKMEQACATISLFRGDNCEENPRINGEYSGKGCSFNIYKMVKIWSALFNAGREQVWMSANALDAPIKIMRYQCDHHANVSPGNKMQ